jgi:hypothetical protein
MRTKQIKQNWKVSLTSKEYYNTYFELKQDINKEILFNLVKDLYTDINQLQELFNKDEHLNNIKMSYIDNKESLVRHILFKKIGHTENNKSYTLFSSSQSCSFIKHILIYDILKIKPIFKEDLINYEVLYEEWISLSDSKKYGINRTSPERYILNKVGVSLK